MMATKHRKLLLFKDPDLTDSESEEDEEDDSEEESEESEEEQEQDKQVEFQWYWESDSAGYKPYDASVSKQLEALLINEVYKLNIHGRSYEIKKTSTDSAIQTNVSNGLYRKAVRRSNQNRSAYDSNLKQANNANHNDESKQSHTMSNDEQHEELEYIWLCETNGGHMESCDYTVSLQLNKLKIGGLYTAHINGTQFQFSKSAADLCTKRNIYTNQCVTVLRQKVQQFKSSQNTHSETTKHAKQSSKDQGGKWYWVTDTGSFEPFNNYISSKLEALKLHESTVVTLGDKGWKYEMKKVALDIVQQRNLKSGNIRHAQRQ